MKFKRYFYIISALLLILNFTCAKDSSEEDDDSGFKSSYLNEDAVFNFAFAFSMDSTFAKTINKTLINDYKDQANIYIFNMTENVNSLTSTNSDNYDVILVMVQCRAASPMDNALLTSYFNGITNKDKIILYITKGNSPSCGSFTGIDAVTQSTASITQYAPYITDISEKIDQIISVK